MNKQLIAQLQLLIELAKTGEEFELSYDDTKFRILDDEVQVNMVGNVWIKLAMELFNNKIIRKPWKPKVGEKVWCWDFDDSHEPITSYCDWREWGGDVYDLTMYAFGNCFRTKEECEAHPEVRDKLIDMRKEYE